MGSERKKKIAYGLVVPVILAALLTWLGTLTLKVADAAEVAARADGTTAVWIKVYGDDFEEIRGHLERIEKKVDALILGTRKVR